MQCHSEATIGAWQLCLEIMGIVACLTNLLLAVFVSQHVSLYTPDLISEHAGSMEAKVTTAVSFIISTWAIGVAVF